MSEVNRTPAVIGFLIAGALILAVGFLADQDDGPAGGRMVAPALRIAAPASGDSVRNPVTLEFSTPAPLQLSRQGWTADDLHLHLMIDETEVMPAAADIEAAPRGYVWRLPPLEPGTHRLYLTWAGRHHGNIAGPTDTVRVHVY